MKTKLNLPDAEAAFMYVAADIELTLAFQDGNYRIEIVDTSEIPADSKFFGGFMNSFEVACLLFLIGNNDDTTPSRMPIINSCYDCLKKFLSTVPTNLRPVP